MKQKEEQKNNNKQNTATEQIYLRITPEEKEWLIDFHQLVKQEARELGTSVPTLNKLIRSLLIESLSSSRELVEVTK